MRKTWSPATNETRVVKTGRIAFTGDVEALIKAASQLGPKRAITQVRLMSSWERTYLELTYGQSRTGVHACVDITLEASDLPAVVGYCLTTAKPLGIWGIFDVAGGGEDDGLPASKISTATLAAMPVTVAVQ